MIKKQFKNIYITLFISTLICFQACQSKPNNETQNIDTTMLSPAFPYQLEEPNRKIKLPSELDEISGISFWNSNTLACIQDEKGRIYFFGLEEEEILKEERFAKDGDFEDVEVVGKTIYALRSDGRIYELQPEKDWNETKYDTPLSERNDTEGLCYDIQSQKLLIACKAVSGIEEHQLGYRSIFTFDLKSSELDTKPYVMISEASIHETAGQRIGFEPSGIAFHPVTHELYIISSVGKVLIVLDSAGAIKHLQSIDTKNFKQPEGICFAKDGTLYISNEGKGGKANILEFKYLPQD